MLQLLYLPPLPPPQPGQKGPQNPFNLRPEGILVYIVFCYLVSQ